MDTSIQRRPEMSKDVVRRPQVAALAEKYARQGMHPDEARVKAKAELTEARKP